MPEELSTTESLFQKHSSKPYNPKLANVFFKSGLIEACGRGFDKIREACKKYDGALPEYEISQSRIMVLCKACDAYLQLLRSKASCTNDQDDVQDMFRMLVEFCAEPRSMKEITKKFGFSNRTKLRRNYLDQI